jgi:hypothetical protein
MSSYYGATWVKAPILGTSSGDFPSIKLMVYFDHSELRENKGPMLV